MIKVMIVDDEYLLRQLIRNTIDWDGLEFQIVAEAEDGEQTLELIEATMPQLALVDINIPFINGLELSKAIRRKYPNIRIIILTGYEEFQYAKEAVRIGISNYILKPINKEELEQAILEARKDILKEQEQSKYIDNLKIEVKRNDEIQKEKFLCSIITRLDAQTNQSLQASVDYFELGLSDKGLVVVIIEIDHFEEAWKLETDKQLWKFAVHKIACGIINENNAGVLFINSDSRIVCIINESTDNSKKEQAATPVICEEIRKNVKEHLHFTITIGIGTKQDGFSNIYLSYNEAEFALKTKFLQGKDRVLEYTPTGNKAIGHNDFIVKDKDAILINLRLGNRAGFMKQLKTIFVNISDRNLSKGVAEMIAIELAAIPFTFIVECNLFIEEVVGQKTHFIELIKSCETIDELEELIIKLYEDTVALLLEKKRTKPSQIVEKTISYIENNYSKQNLSLEKIAENVFINSCYLSKVFKRELKVTVIEYLTDFRMKMARNQIQKNPNIQLGEVAQCVGYSDPYYFSKSFKKHFGISPSRYMEKSSKLE